MVCAAPLKNKYDVERAISINMSLLTEFLPGQSGRFGQHTPTSAPTILKHDFRTRNIHNLSRKISRSGCGLPRCRREADALSGRNSAHDPRRYVRVQRAL